MEIREIAGYLQEARKLLRSGWMQEDYSGTIGKKKCYCAAGAIREVAIGKGGFIETAEESQKVNALCGTLKTVGKLRGRKHDIAAEDAVIRWNDAKGRKKQEVVDKFTAVINGLRAKKGPSTAK